MKKLFGLLTILLAMFVMLIWAARAETNGDTGTGQSTASETDTTAQSTIFDSSFATSDTTSVTKTKPILSLSVSDSNCTAGLKDIYGQPISKAQLQFNVDSTTVYGVTDSTGLVTIQVANPQNITCVFSGSDKYLSVSKSWEVSATGTVSSSTEDTTIKDTAPSIPPVGGIETPPVGTVVITDPENPGIYDDETEPSVSVGDVKTNSHSNWISTLMIVVGILLFVGAGLVVFLFVIRREKVSEGMGVSAEEEAVGPSFLAEDGLHSAVSDDTSNSLYDDFDINIDFDNWQI